MNSFSSYASRGVSTGISISAYLIAIGLAIAVIHFLPDHWHPLAKIAVADGLGTVTIFLFSFMLNNSSMYDPYWSVKPPIIALYYLLAFPEAGEPIRRWLVLILVFCYGLRLTANFYRGWPGLKHCDWRYTMLSEQNPKSYWLISLAGIHFFPTIQVYLACLPLYPAMLSDMNLHFFDIIGAMVMLAAIIFNLIADEQMRNFRKNPQNSGQIMRSGVWKYSRHPNYFGEIMTWWGLWLFALACGWQWWWTGIGALTITLMFIFISIPMMDERLLERKNGFKKHMRKTRLLLPLPVWSKTTT